MTHWLLVSSPTNFETSRARGFDIAGMKTRWKKAASGVQPGDTVFFYLTGVKSIGGEALVTGEGYEDYENAKKWPAKNWTLAFQGNVHRLTDHDYDLISGLP